MNLKEIILAGILALTSCASLRTVTPFESATGKKPKVEYFFAPSCKSCSNSLQTIKSLRETFGDSIDLEIWCAATERGYLKDERLCREMYGQDVQGGVNRLYYLNEGEVDNLPLFYVSGEQVGHTPQELCLSLQYPPDCLK